MKKDWTEIVKDKLSERTVSPPDDLWAAISSDLDVALHVKPERPRSKAWRWWAVAACLAGVLLGGIYFNLPHRPEGISNDELLADNETSILENTETHTPNVVEIDASQSTQRPTANNTKKDDEVKIMDVDQVDKVLAQSHDSGFDITEMGEDNICEIKESDTAGDPKVPEGDTASPNRMQEWPDITPIIIKETKDKKHIAISLYASNTNMPNLDTSEAVYMANATVWGDYNVMIGGAWFAEATQDYKNYELIDTKHRQPLRFGLSARYPLNDEVSISSGLVYSHLTSNMTWSKSQSHSHCLESEQTLNYIGVPLQIDYILPTPSVCGVYLTGGVMTEKCIDGKLKTTDSHQTNSVTEKALQMSILAGVGLQLNITNHISLYAEPLATYYIDNHSDIINIYKERKLNLDLRIGLRYTIK